jgi:hypothetical protein
MKETLRKRKDEGFAEPSRLEASSVHFTPGARTTWHIHPNGQTIYVTEGVGLCQRRGGEIEVIRPGDRVFFEPGEIHWHGPEPLHDPPRDARGRRPGQSRHWGLLRRLLPSEHPYIDLRYRFADCGARENTCSCHVTRRRGRRV